MELNLKNQTALITGASKGVGRSIAIELAAEGVNVVVGYSRDEAGALDTAGHIQQNGAKAVTAAADVSTAEGCNHLFKAGLDAFGSIDILVNNAGMWPAHWIQDITPAEWHKVVDVNLTAVFLMSQLFIRHRLDRKMRGGKILNITSQAAFTGSTTGHSHYAASKAGVVAFTVSTAREVAQYGMNVNALALGIVETEMLKAALAADRKYYENRIPLGRVASPDDIAKIAVFLVSEPAAYITGATIDATGGMLMR